MLCTFDRRRNFKKFHVYTSQEKEILKLRVGGMEMVGGIHGGAGGRRRNRE